MIKLTTMTDILKPLATGKFWKELIIMTLGMSFGAAAVYYFLIPSKLIIGSISGLSIVLSEVFGNLGIAIKTSTIILIINAKLTIIFLYELFHNHVLIDIFFLIHSQFYL